LTSLSSGRASRNRYQSRSVTPDVRSHPAPTPVGLRRKVVSLSELSKGLWMTQLVASLSTGRGMGSVRIGDEMRLEPLCRLLMRYEEGAWVRPFGTAEGAGFGWGNGTVSGDVVRGSVRWANYPRRREDGVWTPNLRGVITAEEGAEILISLHGQSVQEGPPVACAGPSSVGWSC
jgi:hypothetical protein